MNTQPVASIHLQGQASSLLLYQSVPTSEVGCGFSTCCKLYVTGEGEEMVVSSFHGWFKALLLKIKDYLITQIHR